MGDSNLFPAKVVRGMTIREGMVAIWWDGCAFVPSTEILNLAIAVPLAPIVGARVAAKISGLEDILAGGHVPSRDHILQLANVDGLVWSPADCLVAMTKNGVMFHAGKTSLIVQGVAAQSLVQHWRHGKQKTALVDLLKIGAVASAFPVLAIAVCMVLVATDSVPRSEAPLAFGFWFALLAMIWLGMGFAWWRSSRR